MIEKIRAKVKQELMNSRGSHDLEHTMRVYLLAVRIAEKEGADVAAVKAAALLHDIARRIEDDSGGKICHAEKGAEEAGRILAAFGMEKSVIGKVKHCIRSHRFRNGIKPESLEAKVLFDADKLDSIGAVGIGRAFLFAGEVGAKFHNGSAPDIENTKPYSEDDTAYREYMVKLRKIKGKMLTAEGKKLAAERHAFMEKFFEKLDREIKGKE